MRITHPVSFFVDYPNNNSIRVHTHRLNPHQKVALMNSLSEARLKLKHCGKSVVVSVSTQKQLEGFR
jgi:hypothetical protein